MKDLNNVVVVKVDSLLARGTILELIDIEVAKGKVEVLDCRCMSEIDILIGNYPLQSFNTEKISLEGTEPLILKIGEKLLQEMLVTADEVYDIRSTLSVLSGSAGYERTISVVDTLQDFELNMLVCWMYATSILRYNSTNSINVGVKAVAGEYRQSDHMKIKIKDVIEAYQLEHQFQGEKFIEINVTVIPSWWWIKNLKETRNTYNHILKKRV